MKIALLIVPLVLILGCDSGSTEESNTNWALQFERLFVRSGANFAADKLREYVDVGR